MVFQKENSRGVLYDVEGACFFKGGTGGREGGRKAAGGCCGVCQLF